MSRSDQNGNSGVGSAPVSVAVDPEVRSPAIVDDATGTDPGGRNGQGSGAPLTSLATRSEQSRALLHRLVTRRYARLPLGTAIVGRDRRGRWQIVWCPDARSKAVTVLGKDEVGFPGDDAEGIVSWLAQQPWAVGANPARYSDSSTLCPGR
jgi:hypothetical protein